MEPENPAIRVTGVLAQEAGLVTEEVLLAPHDQSTRQRRRKAPWVIAIVVVMVVASGLALAFTRPFAGGAAKAGGDASVYPTGLFTVVRQDLSSQTQVSATLGYAGSYTIAAPSGTSPEQVAQDQLTVTEDQQTLSADEQTESDQSTADNQQVAANQSGVEVDESTLASDQAAESQACTGSGASTPTCSSDQQKVSSDQAQLSQANQQLESAQSAAALAHDQNQAKVQSDQTRLQGDQATLAYAMTSETNPGTTYTWLPSVGAVITQNEPVYTLSNEPVPLLYGSVPASRAF